MQRWWAAAGDPSITGAFDALADHAADALSTQRPICLSSGECCHFAQHGHALLVTGLEAALVCRRAGVIDPCRASRARELSVCAYLSGRSCGIHPSRPLGCRAYFCDPGTADWQARLAESMHGHVRRLHEEHDLPYLFAEWTWFAEAFSVAHARGLLPDAPGP